MEDKQIIEGIIRNIASSFSGEKSTEDWNNETIWFDAAPYACVGKDKAIKVFNEAFGNLQSWHPWHSHPNQRQCGLGLFGAEMGHGKQGRKPQSCLYDEADRLFGENQRQMDCIAWTHLIVRGLGRQNRRIIRCKAKQFSPYKKAKTRDFFLLLKDKKTFLNKQNGCLNTKSNRFDFCPFAFYRRPFAFDFCPLRK